MKPAKTQQVRTGAHTQHKMLAVLKGLDLYEPVGCTPSTHILKPDHPDSDTFPASAYLEWITMSLACAAKLATPPFALLHVPQPVYAVERFDRQFDRADFAPETAGTPPAVQRALYAQALTRSDVRVAGLILGYASLTPAQVAQGVKTLSRVLATVAPR